MKQYSVRRRLCVVLLGLLFAPGVSWAMTSTNYQVLWDSVNSGGEDTSTSTNFRLRDTIGEQATGFGASENYQVSAGYRVGDDQEPSLSLVIGTQENSTRVAWSSFSDGGNTVTVSSTAPFSIGNYIGVTENEGASQRVAVGKITNINGGTGVITVDDWDGEPGSVSGLASGGDDYAFRLGGGAAGFGTQSFNGVTTAVTMTDVLSNVLTGYSVTVQASSTLQNMSGWAIQDVSDGAVTAGSEEYGAEVVGVTAQGVGSDFAIPTASPLQVQGSAAVGDHDYAALIYKLSVTAGTPSGNYNQTVFYRLTPNF